MKNKIILKHAYGYSGIVVLTIMVLFFTAVSAFGQQIMTDTIDVKDVKKDTISLAADSTIYNDYKKQKDDLVQYIVQKQSELYEAKESLDEAYIKLSQFNIALQLYEEKFKLFKQLKEEKK